MCSSNFVEQTRRSLNPLQDTKNAFHPAVLLHQAEGGLTPAVPAGPPATQAGYAPDVAAITRQRNIALRENNVGAFSSLLPAGPSVATGSGSLLGG